MHINWITVVFFVAGAILYAYYGAQELWRTFAMRRLAKRIGFSYLDRRLPEALSLYGTPFAHREVAWNIIDGTRNRLHVVIFDCQLGSKGSRWRRTVIAVRTGSIALNAAKFDPRLRADSSGGWSILYYPPELKLALMPLKELRAYLSLIQGVFHVEH